MSTEWNFDYHSLTTRDSYNTRPYYSCSNLLYNSGATFIYGFSLAQLDNIQEMLDMNGTVVVNITLTNDLISFGSRNVSSIDRINKRIYFTGAAFTTGGTGATFNFYPTPGYLFEVARALTGQELHDNFYNIAEGLTNHQERVSTLEGYRTTASDPEIGYVAYNGYTSASGYLYGGSPLNILATVDLDLGIDYSTAPDHIFSIALDGGVRNPLSSSIFYEINITSTGPFATVQEYCDKVNALLINHEKEEGFAFRATNPYGIQIPYDTGDWDDPNLFAGFYLRINDALDENRYAVMFSEDLKPTNLTTLESALNVIFGTLGISSLVEADIVNPGIGDRLRIRGITPACTRLEIENLPGGSFIESVLRMTASSIFDFSPFLQFQVATTDPNKLQIVGKITAPSFKINMQDHDTTPALVEAGFPHYLFFGYTLIYHSRAPSSTSSSLNFDGTFSCTTLSVTSGNLSLTGTLSADALSATSLSVVNLTVTGLNTDEGGGGEVLNVKSEDFYVDEMLYVKGTTTLVGATTITGATSISGDTTISGNFSITNTDYDNYKSFYVSSTELTHAPLLELSDTTHVYYNGNFGAYSLKAQDSIKILHDSATLIPNSLFMGAGISLAGTTTLNFDGNFKAVSLTGTSSRKAKTNIVPSTQKALDMLLNTLIVDYNLKSDLETPRIGFIAEDTNSLLSGVSQDGIDITNCIGTIIKSIQELYTLVKG